MGESSAPRAIQTWVLVTTLHLNIGLESVNLSKALVLFYKMDIEIVPVPRSCLRVKDHQERASETLKHLSPSCRLTMG